MCVQPVLLHPTQAVKEDVVTLITAAYHVIQSPWKLHSHFSGHGSENFAKKCLESQALIKNIWSDLNADDAVTVKRLVIKSISPAYLEKSRREPQKYVWPYAILSTEAQLPTAEVDAEIRVPIIAGHTTQ